MLANNETGVIQPVAAASALVRAADGWLHVDAVQAAGKIASTAAALGADTLALSAHKLGGPQGVGALVAGTRAPHPSAASTAAVRSAAAGPAPRTSRASPASARPPRGGQRLAEMAEQAHWRDAVAERLKAAGAVVLGRARNGCRRPCVSPPKASAPSPGDEHGPGRGDGQRRQRLLVGQGQGQPRGGSHGPVRSGRRSRSACPAAGTARKTIGSSAATPGSPPDAARIGAAAPGGGVMAAVKQTVEHRRRALEKYKHGFTTDIEQEFAPKGLSEDIVRFISAKKDEPEWMLDWRLDAYRRWLELEEPTWAKVNFPKIDYQDSYYYAAPKQKAGSQEPGRGRSGHPGDLQEAGHPAAEQEVLAGVEGAPRYAVDAVFDSVGRHHLQEGAGRRPA
jgi:hypothetical protein